MPSMASTNAITSNSMARVTVLALVTPAPHKLTDRLFLELPQPNPQQQKVEEKQRHEHRRD
jgi:hypothetical protein